MYNCLEETEPGSGATVCKTRDDENDKAKYKTCKRKQEKTQILNADSAGRIWWDGLQRRPDFRLGFAFALAQIDECDHPDRDVVVEHGICTWLALKRFLC